MCLFHLIDQVVDRDKMDNIFVYVQRPARSRVMIHTPTNERKSNFVVTYFVALTSSAEEKRDEERIVA